MEWKFASVLAIVGLLAGAGVLSVGCEAECVNGAACECIEGACDSACGNNSGSNCSMICTITRDEKGLTKRLTAIPGEFDNQGFAPLAGPFRHYKSRRWPRNAFTHRRDSSS